MNRPRLDPALAALFRALRRLDGGMVVMLEADSTPWASATFSGARHRLRLRCEGAGGAARAAALAAGLREREFDLAGHLVADIGDIRIDGDTLALAALTVVDG